MRLGVNLGVAGKLEESLELALEAERLGFDSAWVSESNGREAFTFASWVAAQVPRITIGTAALQMFTRTPTATAMSAATLSSMSGGRFVLGLGVSTAEILSAWHGVEVERPLERAAEYIAVVRHILASPGERLEFAGRHYRIPLHESANGFRLRLDDTLSPVPIYLAALGPRSISVATQVCEGWLSLFS